MSSSLEDELSIPKEATLTPSEEETRNWSIKTSSDAKISISEDTAIRSSPRCLVVGRQAKVSDIRIQHGSISRKHAALYYLPGGDLVLNDFGSKKGTTVNGTLIQGQVKLIEGDEIIFGNVRESVFRVHCERAENSDTATDSNGIGNGQSAGYVTEQDQPALPIKQENVEPGAGLTGRTKREAEIAAMMESLEEAPTYRKYVPTASEIAESKASEANNKFINPVKQDAAAGHEHITPDNLDEITRTAKEHKLPILERMAFSPETERRQMVTCLAMDPSGARFAVGNTDNTLLLYDFGGMDRLRQEPFKMLQADEGHIVSDMCYSNTGDRLLVGTGSSQPYVLDRDGAEIMKFVRGDMYVVDQAKTTGHTASVTGVYWHPLERDRVLTSSADGSARLWNLNGKTQFEMLVCDKVFQPKSSNGQRTAVQCVAFHPGGREFAVGTTCGSIQIWNTSRVSGRPERAVFDAHGPRKPVNAIVFNVDGSKLCSRSSEDDTCKVWDTRRLSRSASPWLVCANVTNVSEHCSMDFNSNGKVVCVGTAQRIKTKEGKLVENGGIKFFQVPKSHPQDSPSEAFLSLDVSAVAGVTVVKWHPKLNQIFLGCSDGKTEVLFDPQFSSKGALLPFVKAGRQVDGLSELLKSRAPTGSAGVRGQIIAPNAIPIAQGTKRKRGKEADDPTKSRVPEPPAAGFKTGTQSGAGVNFTQFVVDSKMKASKSIAGKDPREELMKYKDGKSYISQAYEGNKEHVLADRTVEQEELESKKKSKK